MTSKEKDLLGRIAQLEIGEMDDIILAVRERFGELHPDAELIMVSIPKASPKERTAFFEWLIRYVRDHEWDILR